MSELSVVNKALAALSLAEAKPNIMNVRSLVAFHLMELKELVTKFERSVILLEHDLQSKPRYKYIPGEEILYVPQYVYGDVLSTECVKGRIHAVQNLDNNDQKIMVELHEAERTYRRYVGYLDIILLSELA